MRKSINKRDDGNGKGRGKGGKLPKTDEETGPKKGAGSKKLKAARKCVTTVSDAILKFSTQSDWLLNFNSIRSGKRRLDSDASVQVSISHFGNHVGEI